MGVLFDFLQRNDIKKAASLPLVHTTKAHHLKSILETGILKAQPCDVYVGENLNYFFVGRPAYKFPLMNDAEMWELPICFVMSFSMKPNPKRVFPFDSGGYHRAKMPKFLSTLSIDDFEVARDPDASQKIIGAFFNSSRNYFRLKASVHSDRFKSDFDLSLLDAELLALHRLTEYRGNDFDDRQFSIEYQLNDDVELFDNRVEAIVVPSPYLSDDKFWEMVSLHLRCEVLGYECYPLNPENYYYGIYSRVESFLSGRGYFR